MKKITAPAILQAGIAHMNDRATAYDAPDGERSMAKTIAMFNELIAEKLVEPLSEEDGWNFMEILKLVRSKLGGFKADHYEDRTAYAGLAGEAAYAERVLMPVARGLLADAGSMSEEVVIKGRQPGIATLSGSEALAMQWELRASMTSEETRAAIFQAVQLSIRAGQECPSCGAVHVIQPHEDDCELFGTIVIDFDEQRADVIGQNGNDGLHYEQTVKQIAAPDWSKAPEWATDCGLAGECRAMIWANSERYEFVTVGGESYLFGEPGHFDLLEFESLHSRPEPVDGWTAWDVNSKILPPVDVSHIRLRNGGEYSIDRLAIAMWGPIPGHNGCEIVAYKQYPVRREVEA